jgi:hypothetical protein
MSHRTTTCNDVNATGGVAGSLGVGGTGAARVGGSEGGLP